MTIYWGTGAYWNEYRNGLMLLTLTQQWNKSSKHSYWGTRKSKSYQMQQRNSWNGANAFDFYPRMRWDKSKLHQIAFFGGAVNLIRSLPILIFWSQCITMVNCLPDHSLRASKLIAMRYLWNARPWCEGMRWYCFENLVLISQLM